MTLSGIGIRSATITAAVVLATASWLTTAPAAHAAPDPTVSAQPSPAPSTTSAATTGQSGLILNPTAAHPGDPVAVSFDNWDFKSCALQYDDQALQPTSTCTALNGLLTGSVIVPTDATPGTDELITACPTACNGDNAIVTAPLTIVAPLVTTPPTQVATVVVTVPPPPPPAQQTTTSTSGHTATLVAGGAVVVLIGSVLGLLLLRRRPPTIGQPPDVHLVPRPDPGIVTVDPANETIRLHAHVTLRLRPDEGRCRVEAMQP